jgi:hypothetical protein
LQITALSLLRHRPLKLQETGMLEKHHRKATPQRLAQGVPQLIRCAGSCYHLNPLAEESHDCC